MDQSASPTTPLLRVPVTESQRSLLVVDQLVPVGQLYNSVFELELAPGTGPDAVRSALAAVVTVQPALRQTFHGAPEPHARVAPVPDVWSLPFESGADASDAAVAEAVAKLGAHTWDLAHGPLYRFALLCSPARTVLLFVVHHLVFDAISVRPFVQDLEEALAGRRTAADVARLARRRADALVREAEVQRRVSAEPETAAAARAWAAELPGTATVLNPVPHRPAETSFAGARREWLLDPAETAALARAVKELELTEYEFLLAVYGAVVARHAAAESVVIGSPFTARRTVGSFELCGFFVNTLPLGLAVDWDRPFEAYARGTVRPVVATARSRSAVSFNQIVEHTQPDRSSNRNPVFSSMLAMQDDLSPAPGGQVVAVREHGNGTAKFDLWLGVTPVGEGRRLELEYDTELIPHAVADGLIASLRTALVRAAERPAAPVSALFDDAPVPVPAAPAEGAWPVPAAGSLTTWLRQAALAAPDAVAVEGPEGSLTHGELEDEVARLAVGLRRAGVRPGEVVGVTSGSAARTVAVILAVLRADATYLPCDRGLPADRIAYMLDAAGCRLVVSEDSGDAFGVRTVAPAELAALGEGAGPQDHALPERAEDRSVYVMFSSGSTGRPKAIDMGEGPLLNLTAWQLDALSMDASTRFLQYAPMGFDVSFQEIFPTLAAGGTVISRGDADRRDFPELVARVEESAVTHVYLPVAALRPFVQAAADRDMPLTRLRHVCVSGEQLFVDDVVRAFFRSRPHLELVNLYGPTETHAVTTHRMAADTDWPAHAPIGLPITGVHGYVVDVTGHLAPAGVRGELQLGGVCPAKGYLGAPEQTARGFIADPRVPGGRVYRTGDQVVRDEHGVLHFLGRTDEQVKIRGYRVELGEIETSALAVDGVAKAVAAVKGTASGPELALFLVASDGAHPERVLGTVKEALVGRLPDYMVPRWMVWADAVPMTPNGKVDRAALLTRHEAEFTAARTPGGTAGPAVVHTDAVERGLAAMWAELLAVESVERDASLLELGAHSLMVFTALSRVREEHGVEIALRSFFRSPTIASLAEQIRSAGAGGQGGR
ncbi:non-ribosomal peptide synthetase [Streptomyces boluensis]|uniref:Amino acid adenylation domain-containing protein n=1 Tax=Streptomyces boluensis TaxID=1775135 RepID=A0A964ULC0_9ACTN|nr:non-ribosomal peptide synthetase [Streptomyces boluensis]NBE50757.1 amino acid adenylation domain-containing protein [Streptomyces boluensis]